MWRIPAAALAGGALALAAGPGLADAAGMSSDETSRLERLVRQDCGSCHGMTLRGGLGPPINGDALAGRDPAEVARIILDGIPGTPMPPWRPLMTEEEARWIAEYLLAAE